MQFTQGILFDHFALVAGIPELHGNVTIKKTVLGRPPPPGDCTENRLKHKIVFLWKKKKTKKPKNLFSYPGAST